MFYDSFFTTVGCMDGRCQAVVDELGSKKFNAQYPDTITDAGIVKQIAQNPTADYFEDFKKRLNVSMINHNSQGIIVFGHSDCAGNPIDDKTHRKDVMRAAEFISSLVENKVPVVPVFVSLNGKWEAEELSA